MKSLILLIISAMMFFGNKPGVVDSLFDARIVTSEENGSLKIENIFENKSSEHVKFMYKFQCERKGRAGSAKSSQSGVVEAAPGEEVSLSRTSLSVSPNDAYRIELQIYDGNRRVAEDSLVYPAE